MKHLFKYLSVKVYITEDIRKIMDYVSISMSKTLGRFPRLEHCCEGLEQRPVFHSEIYPVHYTLRNLGKKGDFFDGSFMSEEKILGKLKRKPPKDILYYVYTPYIKDKDEFMGRLSKIGKLSLVVVPFFWREKILKDFPFVEDVFYDGEKKFNVDISKTEIKYEEIDMEPYKDSGAFPILVSKYCPYQCTYCVAQKTGYAERNIDIVEKELKYLKSIGIKKFLLCGNNLTINKERFLRICEIMKNLDVEWSGDGRIDHMKGDMYKSLKESKGTLLFGVESANQKILDKIKKNLTIEQIIENSKKMNKLGIPFRYTFMFGFPWDTKETAEEMVNLRKKVKSLNYHCLFLSALPGTAMFEEMRKLSLIKEEELDYKDFDSAYAKPQAPTLNLSKEEVAKAVKKIMIQGTLNSEVVKSIIKNRKVSEYPLVFWRGLCLLTQGRRSWRR